MGTYSTVLYVEVFYQIWSAIIHFQNVGGTYKNPQKEGLWVWKSDTQTLVQEYHAPSAGGIPSQKGFI